jgi:hypothetical protein
MLMLLMMMMMTTSIRMVFNFISQCAYVQGNISEMAGLPQFFQESVDG